MEMSSIRSYSYLKASFGGLSIITNVVLVVGIIVALSGRHSVLRVLHVLVLLGLLLLLLLGLSSRGSILRFTSLRHLIVRSADWSILARRLKLILSLQLNIGRIHLVAVWLISRIAR